MGPVAPATGLSKRREQMNLPNLVRTVDPRRTKVTLAWMPRALQHHGDPRAVPSARPAPFLRAVSLALLVLALGGVLLWSSPAQAQNPSRILVSNSGHPPESQNSVALDANFPRHAQRFTTGSDAAGYTLVTILVGLYSIADRATVGSELTVTLNEESGGSPGAALCTLSNPSAFGGFGMHSFSAPNSGMDQCPALRANTTYFTVIERANDNTSTIELTTTSTHGGDSKSLEGWSIGNGAHRYVSANTPPWTHSSDAPNLFIRVFGSGFPHPPRVTGFGLHSDNDNPQGIWGNGETIWVSQSGTGPKLFAYNRSDGSRDSSQDFNTLTGAGNERPTGICSDGTTMFVVDGDDNKVYAYTVSTKAHDSTKDITLAGGNTKSEGLWCDADTVWVAEDDFGGSNDIFAYNRADGTQNTAVDFPDLDPIVSGTNRLNANPRGIYSNGETMFVVDDEDATVYAWKVSDQMRDEDKEIALDGDNADPEGLWFDGRVLWVVDDDDDRVYVYDLPGAQPGNNRTDGVPGVRTPTSKDVWAATLTVGDGRIFGDGYISSITPLVGSLSPGPTFTLDGDTYTVINLSTGAGGLAFGLDKEPPREFTLSVGGESFVSPGSRGNVVGSAYGYIWHDVNLSWSVNDTISVVLSVDYAPKKGGELAADVSGIRDSTDGVANAFFHYQWLRVDGTDETDIDGETGPTYTPTDDDVGKHLKVRVVFDDDAGNQEYPRTSPQVGPVGTNSSATGAPAITGAPRAGGMLAVDLSGITDPEGTDAAEFTYQWIRIDGDSEADIPNATRPTYRPNDEDAGKTIKVKVSFTDNEGFQEGPLTSEPTDPIVDADVLVRNTGQTSDGTTRTLTNSRSTRAQAFTTGPNTNGYDLDSIGFLFDDIDNISTAGSQLTVTLRADSSGDPGNTLCTLSDPSSFTGSGVQTFTAPTSASNLCQTLTGNTTYFAVIERGTVTSDTISLKTTNNSNEDPGSATGWAIGNDRHFLGSSSWDTTASQSHQIEVKGASASAPIVSDNRTWVDNRRGHAATGYDNTGAFTIAQGFRTGNTVGIFEVHEIQVDFDRGQPETGTIKVRIVESTAPNDDWEFATPFHFRRGGNYNPQTVTTDGVHTFTRRGGNSALRANTNYFLVIESTNNDPADAAVVRMTGYEGEDSNDGWTVDDYSHSKSKHPNATWTKQDHQVRFRIAGSYWEGIGMAGDSYAFESCVELRRGELTNCVAAIAVPEPADPENPPENVRRSGLVIDPDLFPEIAEWWTGWWQWMHEYIDFPVTMNPLPTGSDYVTMFVGTRDYTAKGGQDYWGSSESVRFDANSNHTQIVKLRVIDDRVEDSGDYFEFFLFQCRDQNGDNCDHLFVDSSVKGIIYNTEESAEISYLNVSDVTVTEGEGATADFTVSLTAPTTAAVYFDYATEDGTARDGTDYTGGSGSAFLANGDTSVTISVDIANDDTWTGDRGFTLKISDAVYAAISDDTGKATIRDDDPQPLTASFTNLPSGHDGEHDFKFNISFNQDVATKYLVMQNDAMTVTNGEVTGAERVNGARDFWKITIEPVDGRDVTVELPVTTDCSATGAVCTGGDNPQPLSNSITHTFPGTKLNAGFEGFDHHHDGSTPMQFRLVFSEEVDTTAAEIKDHALTVTGATITSVVQEDEGSTRRWNVTVRPAGTGPIDVILASATDCALDGHICTPDGELLARGYWKRSFGPPAISVADANVTEGDRAQLTFAVTLDRDWSGPIPTVSYATSDGTASASSDYTAGSGTLTLRWTQTGSLIRPWTLAGAITVPVTNDTVVEETETLTLTLSSPVWATLGDAIATGTIQDDDTAPEPVEPKADDSAPTGLPTITGTPEADSALTADTSAIDDANGLTGVSYSYQWILTTGGTDADIDGATASTYTPRTAHVGKTLKVRVSFTDDDDYQHTLTSEPTTPITKPADATVWSADMLVVEYTDISIGAATADLFSNIGGSGNLQIKSLWSYVPDSDLRLAFTHAFDDAEDHQLIVGDLTLEFPADSSGEQSFKWTGVDLGWEDGQTIAVSIVPKTPAEPVANTAATGEPTISGTPQVGQNLTAGTADIGDADGLDRVSYNYQWLAGDANIQHATARTYTPGVNDVDKTIRVKVSFTDDQGNAESLNSIATAAVLATVPTAPQGLTVTQGSRIQELDASWQEPSSNGGSAVTGYKLQWREAADSWDTAADVSQTTVTGTTHTITGLTGGVEYAVRVMATNDEGDSPASTVARGTPAAENNAPTGLPTISGTPQVGETLTASTSNIDDEDGLDNVSYSYQWVQNDGTDDADIAGETGSTYTLVDPDEGQTIRVKVSFTDDADNDESLTSAATETVLARPNRAAAGLPTIGGTPQVNQTLTADTSAISDEDGLTSATFEYQWTASGTEIDRATNSTYTLTASEQGKTIQVKVSFTDDADNDESLTSEATVAVAAAAVPLTAEFQALPDSHDGSTTFTLRVLFSEDVGISYANMRDDAFSLSEGDVTGARRVDGRNDLWEITVEPDDNSDVGITLPANRSCTTTGAICTREDNPRQLTNSPTATVTGPTEEPPTNTSAAGAPTISGTPQVDQTLTADTSAISDEDGLTNVSWSYQWTAGGTDIEGATSSTYTLTYSEQGQTIQVRVTFTDDADNEETLTSVATVAVAAAPNRSATGKPTIGGTPQVDQTLTADTSPIDDADGLANVSYGYQWTAAGTDIDGATGASFTLTASQQGKTIQVQVTFTDDRGNAESLTSEPTDAVAAKPTPLTVRLKVAAPATHDGSSEFTFDIEFSEEFGISYATLRDHAFTVTGGSVETAQRTDKPSNIPWLITVKPQGNGDVTIELPATTDCAADGAICTGDGRKLSNSLSFTVSGPGQ